MMWDLTHESLLLTEIPPKAKKELQAFLGIITYLSKFSPSTADICTSLRHLTSVKIECTWNATYQKLFHKAKSITKEDACVKFYDDTKHLYPKTDASGVGLGTGLLQTRSSTHYSRDKVPDSSILRPIAIVNKSLSSTEKRCSNIEREALGILYGLKKFHHYCFAREVSKITDYKSLVAVFKKRCSNTIPDTAVNSNQNTLIQSENHIQTWTRSIHSRLTLQKKPQGKQRQKYLACNYILMPYKQLQISQIA